MKSKLLNRLSLTFFMLMTLMLSSVTVNAQRSIVFEAPLPAATIKEGQTQVVTFKYTTTAADGIYQVRFVRKDRNEPWGETNVAPAVAEMNLPAAPQGQVATASFTVPSDALTTTPLGPDQYYAYIVSLFNSDWSGYIDNTKEVVITSNLGTKTFDKETTIVVTQNPVGDQLLLSKTNEFDKASIFDVTGKKVMEFKTSDGSSIDVSHLTSGMYFLVSDTNVKTKFVKK